MKTIEATTPFENWLEFHESLDWKDGRIFHQNMIKTFVAALQHDVNQRDAFFVVANTVYNQTRGPVDWGLLQKCWQQALGEWRAQRNRCLKNQVPVLTKERFGYSPKPAADKMNGKATGRGQAAETFVIDGMNVIYGSPSHQIPSFKNVLGLELDLLRRNSTGKLFFDANTFTTLCKAGRKEDAYCYRRFCHDYPDLFIEVSGGTPADVFLLDYANRQGMTVISNDLFRDFQSKYEWLRPNSSRRVSFVIHSGMIQVVPLEIQAAIPTELSMAEAALRSALGKSLPAIAPLNGANMQAAA